MGAVDSHCVWATVGYNLNLYAMGMVISCGVSMSPRVMGRAGGVLAPLGHFFFFHCTTSARGAKTGFAARSHGAKVEILPV